MSFTRAMAYMREQCNASHTIKFHQGTGWAQLPATTRGRADLQSTSGPDGPTNASEGYCRGASLDWLRKRLVHGHQLTPAYGASRITRMVAAWAKPYNQAHALSGARITAANTSRTQLSQQSQQRYSAEHAQAQTDYSAAWDRIGTDLSATLTQITQSRRDQLLALGCTYEGDSYSYETSKTTQVTAVNQECNRREQEAIAAATARRTAATQARGASQAGALVARDVRDAGSLAARDQQVAAYRQEAGLRDNLAIFWADVAAGLDSEFRRKNGAAKGFANMRMLASRGPAFKIYASTSEFLYEAVFLKGFLDGTGLLVGFDMDKPNVVPAQVGTGHAVAIYCDSVHSWELFDPNYGVITFQSRDDLATGLARLVKDAYSGGSTAKPGGECYLFAGMATDRKWGDILLHQGNREQWNANLQGAPANTEAIQRFKVAKHNKHGTWLAAKALLRDTRLREAAAAQAVYDAARTEANQRTWVALHNEATELALATDMTVAQAGVIYPRYTGARINIV